MAAVARDVNGVVLEKVTITPITQIATTAVQELVGLTGFADNNANATNMNSNGNSGTTKYNFNDVVKALKNAGILKA